MNKKFKGASTLVATEDPADGSDAATYDEAAGSETAAPESAGASDSEQVMVPVRAAAAVINPSAPPDYFGPYPNYANSPFPTVDPVTR